MDPIQQFGIGKASGSTPAANKPQTSPLTGGQAPSFHALLEKLELQAGQLGRRDVPDATNLAGAMDEAKASLEGALELGRELVEAYREAELGKDEAA
jgi:hypothetical protein